MNIGAHVSVAGGISKSIANAQKIGAQGIQSFASSPRSINFKPYDDEEITKYNLARKDAPEIKFHVFHGVYLVNLAHENPEYIERCIESLSYYQTLASQINAIGTVFHTGSHKGVGLAAVIDGVSDAIVKVLSNTPEGVTLYLENAAGQNGVIGQTFAELQNIIEAVNKKSADGHKLGVCLDTQHAFASGYDIRSQEGIETMLDEFEDSIGLERLGIIHANDSLTPFDSKKDRHANIGEGEIGTEGFRMLLSDSRLTSLPWVLEVPGEKRSGPRKEDIEELQSLISKD